jgi:hypothetical protein
MDGFRWADIGVVNVLYLAVLTTALALGQYGRPVGVGMTLFAVLIVLVDWHETREIRDTVDSRRQTATFLVLTVLVLAVWGGLATRDPTQLAAFFALTAGFFSLVAVRETLLLGLSPVELVLEGYASLVAVYLVLGAASDAVDRFQGVLVVLAIGVYVGRNLVWWTGVALSFVRNETP